MKTFLELVSEDLYSVFGGDFSKVVVVFPNKRGSLFMNRCLAGMSAGVPIMTPRYESVDELFSEKTDLVVADPIYLVERLYEVYSRVTGTSESLDRFYAWGELLLSDFEDIDNNMVDAEAVFRNIRDLDELTAYDYLTEEQRLAIREFFGTGAGGDGLDGVQQRWLSVWSHLYKVYDEYRTLLRGEGWAYGGMLKREVVERLESEGGAELGYSYVFVGFGVLNETEKRLFKAVQQTCNTLFYWDYDEAYLQSEAGMFVRENMRMFPGRFDGQDCYGNMRSGGKRLTYVAAATEDAGLRYAGKWVETTGDGLNTAVVLCNERGLGSVLHSLSAIPNLGEMNVTMGYPLSDSPIYSLIAALIDLQVHGRTRSGSWRYTVVAGLLRHPYASVLTGGGAAALLDRMNREAVRFPTQEFLCENADVGWLFKPVASSAEEMNEWMSEVVCRLGEKGSEVFDELAVEGVFITYTLLNRMRPLVTAESGLSAEMYGRLLLTVMRSRSVPFHGEPAVGLQVMGLLETRNLDFENVLLLSAGEGFIPRIHSNNSFIPYALRAAYGMTTIERQNGLYAYYFYRLIQRAKKVTFVYSTATEGTSRGEMSRFLLQLQLERRELFGEDVVIENVGLTADNALSSMRTLEISSSEEAYERICRRFDTRYDAEYKEKHGGGLMTLSPSAINEYIGCQRRFFLHYVAELRPAEDMDAEDVDDATFGTLLHECMERIYRPLVGQQVQSHVLLELARDSKLIEDTVDAAFERNVFGRHGGKVYNGHQLLNRHVLIEYVGRQLRYDAGRCPFRLLGVERPVYTIIEAGGHRVRIGGIIDRYEQTADGRVRVVDYKTTTKPQTSKDLDMLFDGSKADRAYHILQALYYCDILTEQEERAVFPQLMYVKQGAESRADSVAIGGEEITDFRQQYKEAYHERLVETIERIFSPDSEFAATAVEKNCEYCDFKALCGR